MPTYRIKFDMLKYIDDRTAEQTEPKEEIIMAKNKSYAQLYLLNKHLKEGSKDQIRFIEIEILIDNSGFYSPIH